MTDNRLYGRGMACMTKGCGHNSRDHNRWKRNAEGYLTGRCTIWDCDCMEFIKPKVMKKNE